MKKIISGALRTKINLIPDKVRLCQALKKAQTVVLVFCLLLLAAMVTFTVKGYIEKDQLNKELAENKRIIAEGHLDELNALKEQYDNLILGLESGNITLIPDIDIKMTELFSIIAKHKPEAASLTGVEGQLKSTGEYTYRMEYSSSDRTVIAGFLERLQKEQLEYINVSTISKSSVNENTRWVFSITVKIGGIAE